MRRLVVVGGAIALLLLAVLSVQASTSYVARLGTHGAARWTLNTSVYVNLNAMTAGIWKQQLWSGTCAAPGIRTAVLPSLVVPATHGLAKTTKVGSVAVTDSGVVLRLIQGTSVVCGTFLAPVVALPSGSPSSAAAASPTASAVATATATASETAAPTQTPIPTPTPTSTYMYTPPPTYTYPPYSYP